MAQQQVVYTTNPQGQVVYQTNVPPVVAQNQRPQYRDKDQRIAVPAMPMPAAVVCCILNFLIPGFGTICAGFSSFCCSRNEDLDTASRWVSCGIGWGIGCAQMITFVLCFVGWFWSCAWGIFFIGMSSEYYHNKRIAPDGGYVDRPGGSGAVIVTQQPYAYPATQPVYPPAYSTVPQATPAYGMGAQSTDGKQPIPDTQQATAPPPPPSYHV